MEWYYIFIICLVVFDIITCLGLTIVYFSRDIVFWWKYKQHRDKLTRCLFLMPNGTIKDDVYLVHDDDKMVLYEDGNYQVIPELGFYSTKRNILTMVYSYDNPSPINFNHMDKNNIPEYDSQGLQKALQAKFIRDLLTESNRMLLLLILVIVNTGLSLLIALKVMGVLDKVLRKGG